MSLSSFVIPRAEYPLIRDKLRRLGWLFREFGEDLVEPKTVVVWEFEIGLTVMVISPPRNRHIDQLVVSLLPTNATRLQTIYSFERVLIACGASPLTSSFDHCSIFVAPTNIYAEIANTFKLYGIEMPQAYLDPQPQQTDVQTAFYSRLSSITIGIGRCISTDSIGIDWFVSIESRWSWPFCILEIGRMRRLKGIARECGAQQVL